MGCATLDPSYSLLTTVHFYRALLRYTSIPNIIKPLDPSDRMNVPLPEDFRVLSKVRMRLPFLPYEQVSSVVIVFVFLIG